MNSDQGAHPPDPRGPRYPFLSSIHARPPYFLTDGYGYGKEVSALRWWWQRLKQKLGVIG
jgi:hypothetical protein